MPYRAGQRLPGEKASKLGHLEVLKSPLVQQLIASFNSSVSNTLNAPTAWQAINYTDKPLPFVFGIDGSLQTITGGTPPYRALTFVKTALFRMDQYALSKVNRDSPHPYVLRDILADSAMYHATVIPLRHIVIPGKTVYDAIRQTIFDSIKDPSLQGEPMETLKWLAYEKWDGNTKQLPLFECPHCDSQTATLPYDAETGGCPNCGGEIFITDMLGFHLEMTSDSAPDVIASNYMTIHETLLLFTGIKYYWEHDKEVLSNCLFVKDGPLSIRAQYSKLVNPIRRFLRTAKKAGIPVHLLGQEKTGTFVDHLQLIAEKALPNSIFVPENRYILEEIQHRPLKGAPYGRDTNYGAKVFARIGDRHRIVINIPTGEYKENPQFNDLIGVDRILATLPQLLSSRYEDGLIPIELANNIASLSTYPSAQVLALFARDIID